MDYLIALFPNNEILLTEEGVSPIITGGQDASETAAPSLETAGSTADADQLPSGGILASAPMLLGLIALYAVMYFLFFRPQRKQAKELKNTQANIRPGDNVVTVSGLYGKVMDIGEDVFIVEFGTNRGVRIPVSKTEIAAVKDPKMTPVPKT